MKFEIDTIAKEIIIKEDINLEDLNSWIKATVGTQGWTIKRTIEYNTWHIYPVPYIV